MCDLTSVSSVVCQKKQFINIYFSVTAFLIFLLCSDIVPSWPFCLLFIKLDTGFGLLLGASVFLDALASNELGCMFSQVWK